MQSNSIIYKFYYQWWKNIDKPILFLVSILFTIGLFFSLVSTSLIASDKLDTNNYFFFFKHLIYVFIGVIFIFIFSSLNRDKLYKFSIILFFISLLIFSFFYYFNFLIFSSNYRCWSKGIKEMDRFIFFTKISTNWIIKTFLNYCTFKYSL